MSATPMFEVVSAAEFAVFCTKTVLEGRTSSDAMRQMEFAFEVLRMMVMAEAGKRAFRTERKP